MANKRGKRLPGVTEVKLPHGKATLTKVWHRSVLAVIPKEGPVLVREYDQWQEQRAESDFCALVFAVTGQTPQISKIA